MAERNVCRQKVIIEVFFLFKHKIMGQGSSKSKDPSKPQSKDPSKPQSKDPSKPQSKDPSKPQPKNPSKPKPELKKFDCYSDMKKVGTVRPGVPNATEGDGALSCNDTFKECKKKCTAIRSGSRKSPAPANVDASLHQRAGGSLPRRNMSLRSLQAVEEPGQCKRTECKNEVTGACVNMYAQDGRLLSKNKDGTCNFKQVYSETQATFMGKKLKKSTIECNLHGKKKDVKNCSGIVKCIQTQNGPRWTCVEYGGLSDTTKQTHDMLTSKQLCAENNGTWSMGQCTYPTSIISKVTRGPRGIFRDDCEEAKTSNYFNNRETVCIYTGGGYRLVNPGVKYQLVNPGGSNGGDVGFGGFQSS
jgi:hypothetical protein